MKQRLHRTIIFLLVGLGAWLSLYAQDSPVSRLSDHASISLITQWPGEEIYLAFGHSAFRVRDDTRGIDELYNYGVFSLDDPFFLAHFAYGQLDYMLGVFPFEGDLRYDQRTQNRIWHEQVLNLNNEQINEVYQFLATNARPENRVYRYDFIIDNCSTRLRDVLEKVLGSSLQFAPRDSQSEGKSYRNMIDECVAGRPFYQFLIYLVLGTAVDHKVTAREAMWLPQYLMHAFDTAKIVQDGHNEPLVASQDRIFTPAQPTDYNDLQTNPAFVLWPLAVVVVLVSVWFLLRKKNDARSISQKVIFRLGDWLLFFVVGLIGCVVAYLTFISSHAGCKGNLNVMWLWPTHVVLAFFILFNARFRWMRWYFLVASVASIAPVVLWPVWPQGMHPTMIAPMLMLSVRSFSQFVRLSPRLTPPGTSGSL